MLFYLMYDVVGSRKIPRRQITEEGDLYLERNKKTLPCMENYGPDKVYDQNFWPLSSYYDLDL